jgi:hypothetical protein
MTIIANNINMTQTTNEPHYNNQNTYIYNNNNNTNNNKKCKSNTPLTDKWKKSINIIKNNIPELKNYIRCETRDETRDETTLINIQKKLLQHLMMLVERTQAEVTLLKIKNTDLQKMTICLEQHVDALLTDDNQCSVCMAQKKNSAFVECGHLCVCSECAPKCNDKCPLCKTIGKFIKIYQ